MSTIPVNPLILSGSDDLLEIRLQKVPGSCEKKRNITSIFPRLTVWSSLSVFNILFDCCSPQWPFIPVVHPDPVRSHSRPLTVPDPDLILPSMAASCTSFVVPNLPASFTQRLPTNKHVETARLNWSGADEGVSRTGQGSAVSHLRGTPGCPVSVQSSVIDLLCFAITFPFLSSSPLFSLPPDLPDRFCAPYLRTHAPICANYTTSCN